MTSTPLPAIIETGGGYDEKEILDTKKLEQIYGQCQVTNYLDLTYAIAVKSLSTQAVIEKLVSSAQKKPALMDTASLNEYYQGYVNNQPKKFSKSGIVVTGIESMMIELSGCCNPIPGDDITGYVTKGKGVKVHRVKCPNIQNEKARLIDVYWDEHVLRDQKYIADLVVNANDRNFLLSDIVTMVGQCKAGMAGINGQVMDDKITAIFKLKIKVDDLAHLENTMANLRKIESVIEVERVIH